MRRVLPRTERCLAIAVSLSKPAFPSRRFLHESRADAVAYAEVWNDRARSSVDVTAVVGDLLPGTGATVGADVLKRAVRVRH